MAQHKPIRIGDTVPLQQINPATEEIDGKIYCTTNNIVLGRLTAGAGQHEEIDMGDLPGGSVSIIDITYADMATALAGATLTPGQFYRITDAAGTDLGFITQAVRDNEITVNGTGGYLNADFQGVGDYSGVGAVTYVPGYIYYSGASGLFAIGETITGDDNGSTAEVLSDDGSGTLEVKNVTGDWTTETTFQGDTSTETATFSAYIHWVPGVPAGTQKGIWRTGFETVTIVYTNLSGGAFAVGETITGGITGATAVIVSDDGAGSMTAYMTSAGVAFDGSEVLDNGNGITADMDGSAGSPEIVQGDIVIWNLLHWQLIDETLLAGTDPENNTGAYTLLEKSVLPETYLTAWDASEFDFVNNWIQFRSDIKGNAVRSSFDSGQNVFRFQWGNDNKKKVFVSNSNIDIRNTIGVVENVLLLQGSEMYDIKNSQDYQVKDSIIQNAGKIYSIQNSTINRVLVQNTAQIADLENCVVEFCTMDQNSRIRNSKNAVFLYCTLYPNSQIYDIESVSSNNPVIENNILENGASLTGITAGANCSISRNKIGQGATLGGDITFADDSEMNDNVLENGASITGVSVDGQFNVIRVGPSSIISDISLSGTREVINVTLGPDITWSNKTVEADINQLDMYIENTSIETVSAELKVKTSRVGFSNFPAEIDATGLTTIDLLAENQHVGIFNLTSSNSTETIYEIANAPTAFPITIKPAPGLVLTITGTAVSGIAAGQIALTTADVELDGDKGEYIVLQVEPNNGHLYEVNRVAGLL